MDYRFWDEFLKAFYLLSPLAEFWLLKSAQQVLGAVLCCPGCFSLYRGSALRQIVTTYSTEVKTPFDTFLKDMGEDRWLCTLMMLKGWGAKRGIIIQCILYTLMTDDIFVSWKARPENPTYAGNCPIESACRLTEKEQVPRGYNHAPSSVDRHTNSQTDRQNHILTFL